MNNPSRLGTSVPSRATLDMIGDYLQKWEKDKTYVSSWDRTIQGMYEIEVKFIDNKGNKWTAYVKLEKENKNNE